MQTLSCMVSVQLRSVGGVCVASRPGDAPSSRGGAEPGRYGWISTLPPDWQHIGWAFRRGSAGPCFNMSSRSECSDIPALECVIGLEIHVTHFQRLVRELHSEHISPFKKRGLGRGGSSYTRRFLFLFFCFTPRGKCFACGQTDVRSREFVWLCWRLSTGTCTSPCTFALQWGSGECGGVVSQRGKSYFYKLECGRKEKIRAAS